MHRTKSMSSLEKREKNQQQSAGAGPQQQQSALSPVHRNKTTKQRRQVSPILKQPQPQLSPRERARIQRTSSAKLQRRRSSMGGGAALPHISRRISIGYTSGPAGGVGPAVATKNSWGQKPVRRSSLSNQKAARTASSPPPPQATSVGAVPQAPVELDYDDSCSRRSSLSSHGSYFSDSSESGGGGGGTYLSNVSSLGTKSKQLKPKKKRILLLAAEDNVNNNNNHHSDDDDSSLEDDMSYANDSIDVRYKKTKPVTTAKLNVKKGSRYTKPSTAYLDDEDSLLDDDDDNDTYAADSLDLRKYRKQKQKSQKDDDNDDPVDDSMGDDEDTYAADSLDLRRTSQLRHPPTAVAAAPPTITIATSTTNNNNKNALELDDSAADSAYSCAADSLDLRAFRKRQQQQQQNSPPPDLGYGKVAAPTRQDLGYGDDEETPGIVVDTKQKNKTNRQVNDDDGDGSCSSSSYDAYSYAADSLDLRKKFSKIEATARTDTTTEGDDDDSDYDDDSGVFDDTDADSNKTPMDYMTRVVMGYSKKNKLEGNPEDDNDSGSDGHSDEDADSNKTPMDYMTRIVMGYAKHNDPVTSATAAAGDAMRRMSMESTASSVYSYACDSVVMKKPPSQKKALQAASSLGKKTSYANRERYDDDYDDCSDYSDDESHHGGGGAKNPYLSAMLGYGNQGKPKLHASQSFDTGMERRMSCDSYANDSVDMRRKGKKKESSRRESMDSLVSGISTSDVDPSYLQDVLGYAMDASAGSLDPSAPSKPADPRDLLVSATYTNMMDSMTSIGSEGDWALSPSLHQEPKARMPAAKAMQMSGSSLGDSDSEDSSDDLEY